MKISLANLVVLTLTTLLPSTFAAPTPKPNPQPANTSPQPTINNTVGYQTAAYFVNWSTYDRNFQPQQIPVDKLTHVLYAFANVSPDGTVSLTDLSSDILTKYPTSPSSSSPSYTTSSTDPQLHGNLGQLYHHKLQNRHLKTLLSIGGWSLSTHFPTAASTPSTRRRFASTAVSLLQNHGFDGLDIDWEYPSNSQDANNFVLLLEEVRGELDRYADAYAKGEYRFLLTVAAPVEPERYAKLRLKEMDGWVDAWYLMGYDFSGGWDDVVGNTANLFPSQNSAGTPYSIDRAVTDYIAAGVPAHKIILGMPLYGRSFQGTDGIGKSFNGVGTEGSFEEGVWDYKDLPRKGAKEFVDLKVGASWSYDEATKELVSYDTPEVARRKGEYVVERGLGGGMWWEMSADKVGEGSLITTFGKTVGMLDGRSNWVDYKGSVYGNVRAGKV